MSKERRRYFRINETLGIAYRILERGEGTDIFADSADVLDRVSEQDARIEQLLIEVAVEHPKVAELVQVFNQKLERVVTQLAMDNKLVNRIAQRVKEANLSACGIAFQNDEPVPVGTRLELELNLFPGDLKLAAQGRVVACDPAGDHAGFYWRIDFCQMGDEAQEQLIQHIVKRQSAQLRSMRGGGGAPV